MGLTCNSGVSLVRRQNNHPLDIELDFNGHDDEIELLIEELPSALHFASDCASSVGSMSTTGGCIGGCTSSASTVGSMGSVMSTGGSGGGGGAGGGTNQ